MPDINHDPYGNAMSGVDYSAKVDSPELASSRTILSNNYERLQSDRKDIIDRLQKRRDERMYLSNLIDEDEVVLAAIDKACDVIINQLAPDVHSKNAVATGIGSARVY